jgi:hypothetical protein
MPSSAMGCSALTLAVARAEDERMPPRRGISTRKVILNIHLYLGIATAVVLVILSLTGAFMA